MKIGVTERGDAARDLSWMPKLKHGQPCILITKSPSSLVDKVSPGDPVIIHANVTGWGNTRIEPSVNQPETEIDGYQALIEKIGVEKVVLRIDPIFPTPKGIERAKQVLAYRHPSGRVRISFLDAYNHVRLRFEREGMTIPWKGFHAPIEVRKTALKELGNNIEICGEPGFPCQGCVSKVDADTLGISVSGARKGQRKTCNCIVEKTELLKGKQQCENRCLYCYWK